MGRENRFADLVNKKKKQESDILEVIGVPGDQKSDQEKEGEKKIDSIVKESELRNVLPDSEQGYDQEKENEISTSGPTDEIIKPTTKKNQNTKPSNKEQKATGSNSDKVQKIGAQRYTTHLRESVLKQTKIAILEYDLNYTIQEITEVALLHYINTVLPKRKN